MSISFAYDPVLVLSGILKRNAAHLQTPHAFLAMVNPDHDTVTIEYGMGIGENYIGRQLSPSEGVTGQILATNTPHIISHYQEWQGKFRGILPKNQSHVGAVMGTPVRINGLLTAILVFILESPDLCPETDYNSWLTQVGNHATTILADLNTALPTPSLNPSF